MRKYALPFGRTSGVLTAFLLLMSVAIGVNTGLTADSVAETQISDAELRDAVEGTSAEDVPDRSLHPLLPDSVEERLISDAGQSDMLKQKLIEPTLLFFIGGIADRLATFTYTTPWMQHPVTLAAIKAGLHGSLLGMVAYGCWTSYRYGRQIA